MGQEYELNENFRFYMTTKLSRPHFSSEICVLSTILNFQVTAFGLEDQMLNILVAKEDPSSERMRINNIKEFYDLMKKQLQTEAKILSLLTESESDNILDDVNLIQALQKSKEDSSNAQQRIKMIESMKKKLQQTRGFYQKAAFRASSLFFCVSDMGQVEQMYQFSLEWFIQIFKESLSSENKQKETRVQEIIDMFTLNLFKSIQHSLFEKDKLLFSILIYLKSLECDQLTDLDQLRRLFVGGTAIIPKSENPLKDLISDKQWAQLEELSQQETKLVELVKDIRNNTY